MMKKLHLGDMVIALLVICVITFITIHAYEQGDGQIEVHIESADGEWIYPIDSTQDLHMAGPLGDTHIIITDGHVHVSDSPCSEKICIAAGEIASPGQWIACLPNRIAITIRGGDDQSGEVDDVVF